MTLRSALAFGLCMVLISGVCLAAAHEYQTGKIVKVEKQEPRASSGGTDAPLKAEAKTYRISIQLGDKVYVCRYQTDPDADISWIEGKDVEARVSGNAMYVKTASGKETKGSILSSSAAGKS